MKANADSEGRIVNRIIDEYVETNHLRCTVHILLG